MARNRRGTKLAGYLGYDGVRDRLETVFVETIGEGFRRTHSRRFLTLDVNTWVSCGSTCDGMPQLSATITSGHSQFGHALSSRTGICTGSRRLLSWHGSEAIAVPDKDLRHKRLNLRMTLVQQSL